MSVNDREVMARLRAHPLFKKVIAGVSQKEREHIENVVSTFVGQLTNSLSIVASQPGASAAIKNVAEGRSPVSGSAG